MFKFVSMYSREELRKMPRSECVKKLGIKDKGKVLQAPPCRKCGGACIEVDLGALCLQCLDCGHSEEAFGFNELIEVRR